MRRPLALMCLVYIMAVGVYVWLRPPDLNCYEYAEGLECKVLGKLYKIESGQCFGQEQSYFYLNQISYFEVIQENQVEQSKFLKNYNKPTGVVCYMSGDTAEIKPGSSVLITGVFENFEKSTNPGEFDSRIYNRTLGICGKILKASVCRVGEDYNVIADTGYVIRSRLEEQLKSVYPNKEAGILITMLLGNKTELDGEIKELYRTGGILHILSVSGLHISVLGLGLYNILRKIGIPMWIAAVVSALWMWFYGEMIGMGVSAFRAIIMFSVRMAAVMYGRTYDLLTALAIAAAVLVSSEPMYFYHSGFWLSFSCVLAISLLYPLLKIEEKEDSSYWQKMGLRICNSFLVSASITVFTLPVLLWFYYEVSLWGLVWNLIVVPLASVVMGGGIITLFLTAGSAKMNPVWMHINKTLAGIIAKGNCAMLSSFEFICRISEWSGVGNLIVGQPEKWQIYIFVSGMSVFLFIGKKIKNHQRFIILSMLIFILVFKVPQDFSITFLDVGQGDGICIQNKNGNVYLVDGGSSDKSNVGTYQILPFLKRQGIRRIDAVFLTHADKDHISGIEELLGIQKGGIRIEKVVLPDLDNDVLQQDFERVVELCMENKTDIYVMSQGVSFIDDELMLTCMHPKKSAVGNSNEESLVLHLTYKNFSALLTGDVEDHGESILVNVLERKKINSMTLLKVAHHGSAGSTTEELLKQISPQIAVISCGADNPYGHPHEETMERLRQAGAIIMTTPECGAITLEIDGNIQIRTVKHQ